MIVTIKITVMGTLITETTETITSMTEITTKLTIMLGWQMIQEGLDKVITEIKEDQIVTAQIAVMIARRKKR